MLPASPSQADKGKPVERRGRKTTGPRFCCKAGTRTAGLPLCKCTYLQDVLLAELSLSVDYVQVLESFGRMLMGKLAKQLLACAACMLLATGVAGSTAFIGDRAPDFVLPSLQTGNLRLSEYRSEVVVVSFWSSRCGRCRKAMPFFESLYQQHRNSGLHVIAIAVDGDVAIARQLVAEFKIDFPMLLDQQHRVSRLYDLNQMPMTLVIDRDGNVVFIDKGFRGNSGERIAAEVAGLMAE